MTSSEAAYRALPDDARQEFRLPSLLKEHLNQVAAQRGQTVSQYVNSALAERVSHDLATSVVWHLTVPEQEQLLTILSSQTGPTQAARDAVALGDQLFGPLA